MQSENMTGEQVASEATKVLERMDHLTGNQKVAVLGSAIECVFWSYATAGAQRETVMLLIEAFSYTLMCATQNRYEKEALH